MKRSLVVLSALAAFAFSAVPASALNPQPLPPKEFKRQSLGKFNWVLLNPQPLPPRYMYVYRR